MTHVAGAQNSPNCHSSTLPILVLLLPGGSSVSPRYITILLFCNRLWVMSDVAAIRNTGSKLVGQQVRVDSIAVSLFADIFIELTNTRQDGKIQITILILRRGALSRSGILAWVMDHHWPGYCMVESGHILGQTLEGPCEVRLGVGDQGLQERSEGISGRHWGLLVNILY